MCVCGKRHACRQTCLVGPANRLACVCQQSTVPSADRQRPLSASTCNSCTLKKDPRPQRLVLPSTSTPPLCGNPIAAPRDRQAICWQRLGTLQLAVSSTSAAVIAKTILHAATLDNPGSFSAGRFRCDRGQMEELLLRPRHVCLWGPMISGRRLFFWAAVLAASQYRQSPDVLDYVDMYVITRQAV